MIDVKDAKNILFLTKSMSEAKAAHLAGLEVIVVDRKSKDNSDANSSKELDSSEHFRRISSFLEIKFIEKPTKELIPI